MSASEQQSTYPSPNPTLNLTCSQLTVVWLGEGWVFSCSDVDTDLNLNVSGDVIRYDG